MESSNNEWEARAVLNPTVIQDKKGVEHIFYRAVAKDGVSCIGYARIIDGKLERFNKPLISPTKNYEKMGIEDPRITKVDDIYYMLYTVFDGKNARVAYAVSRDLKSWKKEGIISPNILVEEARKLVKIKRYRDKWKGQEVNGSKILLWDKDAVLFPEKIDGYFVMLHRFLPDIQIVRFKNFDELKSNDFWRSYITNLSKGEDDVSLHIKYNWESEHIGAGAVPMKTKNGWLLIYHGVELVKRDVFSNVIFKIVDSIKGVFHRRMDKRLPLVYHAGAMLLDFKKPEIEIGRLKNPLFSPKYEWEKMGDVNNVVFPEGMVVNGDKLKIYYGCADSKIGIAELSLKQLINQITKDS